jgi:hypothetical protein
MAPNSNGRFIPELCWSAEVVSRLSERSCSAQAIVATKIANRHFAIRTDKPNVEVSWQVTGVRHDAFAKAHPLQVSVDKPAAERGFCLHPELFGAPAEKIASWAHHTERMTSTKAQGSQLPPSCKQ